VDAFGANSDYSLAMVSDLPVKSERKPRGQGAFVPALYAAWTRVPGEMATARLPMSWKQETIGP
jgi:hypothetical protein